MAHRLSKSYTIVLAALVASTCPSHETTDTSSIGLFLLVAPVIGIPVLLIGLGGVAMIVVGAVGGSRVSADALAEREALIQKREVAERELGNLRRMGSVTQRVDSAMVTVASF